MSKRESNIQIRVKRECWEAKNVPKSKFLSVQLKMVLSLTLLVVFLNDREIFCVEEPVILISSNPPSDISPYQPYNLMTLGAIRMYQLLIAPSKGSNCPMHPHCSLYGQMVFERYHPVKAFLMTADRIHRCGHDLKNYDSIELNGFVKFYDPISDSEPKKSLLFQIEPINIPSPAFILQESDELSEDRRIFNFAGELFRRKEFDKASIEYQRLIFYFPNSSLKTSSAEKVLQCYYQSGQYLKAVHWGQKMLEENLVRGDSRKETKFYIGTSYFKLNNFPKAREQFQDVAISDDGLLQDKAFLLVGLSLVNQEKWEDAQKNFAELSPKSEFYKKVEQLEKLASKGPLLKQKNPVVAGILAIVPGMGYLYNGYKQTALASFIVNSLFFYGTSEAFKKDNDSLKPIMGILSVGWYAGNIYGSVVSAHRKNEMIKKEFLGQFDVGFKF